MRRSRFNATDHGEIVKVLQLARCGADCGGVPQIMKEIVNCDSAGFRDAAVYGRCLDGVLAVLIGLFSPLPSAWTRAHVDFLLVVEHRLILAWVRGE